MTTEIFMSAILVIGCLAFLVSVITEVFKNVGVFNCRA